MDEFSLAQAMDSTEMSDALQELYVKLEVAQKNQEIKLSTKKFVDNLVQSKTANVDLGNAKYAIDMLVKVETNSLISAAKQTMYLEHIIDTLMLKIDENFGGAVTDYYALMQLQSGLLKMQQHFLYALRQLPINIQNTVNTMLDMFAIHIEDTQQQTDGITIKSVDFIDNIEQIHRQVNAKNAEIDNSKPDELPAEWIVSDAALMSTDTAEEAIAYEQKTAGTNLPGQPDFDESEFDE